MSFFPDTYTGIPQGESNYFKLQEGANTFRVLSSAIIGFQYWTEDAEGNRKPIRVKLEEDIPSGVKNAKDSRQRAKYFWAFVALNRANNQVQVMELTQKTILRQMEDLIKNPKWGDPKDYDITITKTKNGAEERDVDYSVMPEPKEALTKDVLEAYDKVSIDLTALYRGDDPFKAEEAGTAPSVPTVTTATRPALKADDVVDPSDVPDFDVA